jgi:hypothetical protein
MANLQGMSIMYCIAKVIDKSKDFKMEGVYDIRQNCGRKTEDAILELIPGAPLQTNQNIDVSLGNILSTFHIAMILYRFVHLLILILLGLVNGAIVEFHRFIERRETTSDAQVFYPPKYMLVKIQDGPASEVTIPGLPVGVVLIEPIEFTYREGGRRYNRQGRWIKLLQFPVTLGYAITDYKAQGSTYPNAILLDLKRPDKGSASDSAPYVELLRGTTLSNIFIMRPFNGEDLRVPFSEELQQELAWQERMFMITKDTYSALRALRVPREL